jgi:hypothetical protein
MNPKINHKNTIKAHFFWFKTNYVLFTCLKAKLKLHQMTICITIDYEIIKKYVHELVKILSESFVDYYLEC